MSTCKDCIHYEPCKDAYYNAEELSRFPLGFLEKENAEKSCAFFEDRSKYVDVSELNIIMKRQIAQKPIPEGQDNMDYILCPACRNPVGVVNDVYGENSLKKYCHKCGQILDWGDS